MTEKIDDPGCPLVINPWDDCPDKLIWILYGWLAWDTDEHLAIYLDDMRELHRMLVYAIESAEAAEKRRREEAEAAKPKAVA